MLTEEEYIKKNGPYLGRKTARKMYNQYVNIEKTVKNSCDINDFYKANAALAKANVPCSKPAWPSVVTTDYTHFELATIATTEWNTKPCYPKPIPIKGRVADLVILDDMICEKQQGNNPMTDTEISRSYLTQRLEAVSRTKRNELPSIFNLYASTAPKSYKELIDWVKNDKFKLDAKMVKRIDASIDENGGDYYGSFLDGIIFTGAAKVPDNDGFNAAEKERVLKAQAVKDVIYTADAATALKALQDFEAWTPTSTTVAN